MNSQVRVSAVDDDDISRRPSESLLRRVAELEAEVEQLREAALSRQQIGVITGVLTQQFNLTPDQAWLLLRRISSLANLKVRDVARLLHAGFFDRLGDDDVAVATRLNQHLPNRIRLELPHGRTLPADTRQLVDSGRDHTQRR